MANVLKHKTLSGKADEGDPTDVQPSWWDQEHAFAGGADGQVLVRDSAESDGARWADQSPLAVLRVRRVITDAEIKTLSSLPITLVAAPGAGIMVSPIACVTIKQSTAGSYSVAPNFSLRWDGLSDDITTAVSLFLSSANKRWQRLVMNTTGNTTDPMNRALLARFAADVTGGNAANYLVVDVVYELVTDGP